MFLNVSETNSTSAFLRFARYALTALPLLGCANPGPPRPPSLNLPAPVRDLKVQRVANRVDADWTTPRLTTEKTAIPGPITAVLCLEIPANPQGGAAAPGAPSPFPAATSSCVEEARKVVVAGESELTVELTPELAAGPPRLLLFRVKLMNARGRSAGASNEGWTVAGAAPAPAQDVQAIGRPQGVLVTWKPAHTSSENGTMELERRTLVAAPGNGTGLSRATSDLHKPGWTGAAPAHAPPPENEVRLRATDADSSPPDGSSPPRRYPGGLLDRSVESGATYRYVAQRVREITLAGHVLRLLGEASAPAVLNYRDLFAPTAPEGLEAIPEGGFVAAGGQASALAISLSWEPSPEGDVAGYNVYRSGAAGEFFRLNSAPVPAPAYRDATVQGGKRYRYRVTAVDLRNNESAPGPQVAVQAQP